MDENCPVSGAKPKVERLSIEVSRRQNGQFAPYPFGTWRILSLNASKSPHGVHTTSTFSSVQKQNPAHATPEK